MNLAEIGGRIKVERRSRQISQEKLAEIIDVSPHYIYEIERGSKAMSLETLISIAKALSVSTDYILFGNTYNDTDSIYEQLSKLPDDRKERAENAFKAVLPFIL